MISLFKEMAEARFWDNWESRFSMNSHKYIKPQQPEVADLVGSLNVMSNQTDIGIARDISDWIAGNHEYNLTKRWRKPEDTINEGMGDCEDFTFLLASILPHYGVTDFSVVAGDAISDGYKELHVWLEIDGEVIDPTATSLQAEDVEYQSEITFDIKTESY